jgi:hypothetical protein
MTYKTVSMMASRIPAAVDTPTMTAGDKEEFLSAALAAVVDALVSVGARETDGDTDSVRKKTAGSEEGSANE